MQVILMLEGNTLQQALPGGLQVNFHHPLILTAGSSDNQIQFFATVDQRHHTMMLGL